MKFFNREWTAKKKHEIRFWIASVSRYCNANNGFFTVLQH